MGSERVVWVCAVSAGGIIVFAALLYILLHWFTDVMQTPFEPLLADTPHDIVNAEDVAALERAAERENGNAAPSHIRP